MNGNTAIVEVEKVEYQIEDHNAPHDPYPQKDCYPIRNIRQADFIQIDDGNGEYQTHIQM